VSRSEGLQFARRNSMLFIEASAKTRDGVQEAFEELVHKVLQTPSLYVSSEAKDSVRVGGDSGQQDSWCGGSCTVT